ncbi:sensor histidine kinase [uncultured Robinsoniella sp.]|uniref:cache domain-containing sensor histidine kinase n=1 Tax=uncultured Robinsoniella sp. TaxID=904190 RepID=UPI00374E61E6
MKDKLKYFWNSLKARLIGAFIVTSIIPILIIAIFSYVNTSHIVRDNAVELTHVNLQQTKSSLDMLVDSYEDILFQIYMNDDIVQLVDRLNAEEDDTLIIGQLRRRIRGMFYTKEYIKSITIISDSGKIVFYDLLTGSGTQTSWGDSIGMTTQQLYEEFSEDNRTHIIPTKKAGVFAAQTFYLFHIGHRIIDYQNVDKQLGVVMVSVDESLLQSICNDNQNENSFNFIVDKDGDIISYNDKEMIGEHIIDWSDDEDKREEGYLHFAQSNNVLKSKYVTVNLVHDSDFGCDIVNISNQNELVRRLNSQQKFTLLLVLVAVTLLIIIIAAITKRMMGSINSVVKTMRIAGEGSLSVRVRNDKKMPSEILTIATQFNAMLKRLQHSISKEQEANIKQKNAEIAALEAQINPHFLYNTLDTVNWMAVDHDEMEISKAITSLAYILRYGIDNSNGIVKISKECEWLEKYLILQQTRMMSGFQYEIDIDPDILDYKIHKLLLQPFVENSILHGFAVPKETCMLWVSIKQEDNCLCIIIRDNGQGINQEVVKQMNNGVYVKSQDRHCIGMENAVLRIKMYYGNEANVNIESKEGEYTSINIKIPIMIKG